jgi:hypothetical protein
MIPACLPAQLVFSPLANRISLFPSPFPLLYPPLGPSHPIGPLGTMHFLEDFPASIRAE